MMSEGTDTAVVQRRHQNPPRVPHLGVVVSKIDRLSTVCRIRIILPFNPARQIVDNDKRGTLKGPCEKGFAKSLFVFCNRTSSHILVTHKGISLTSLTTSRQPPSQINPPQCRSID